MKINEFSCYRYEKSVILRVWVDGNIHSLRFELQTIEQAIEKLTEITRGRWEDYKDEAVEA